ncbi:hypothetical protein SAMD00019534_046190, partial [Acytostelium subglobosum LB1]|uniref:hypothetical protein n=1 Tax=Acytostelium subglobosum LB1 TaxID=1410327 RepID=UPI000644D952
MSAQEFLDALPMLKEDVLSDPSTMKMPPQARDWISRLIDASVAGGKMNRGLTVPSTLQLLLNRPLTKTETQNAIVLGWGVEWLQAFFLVADDIMDQSLTRRGQPCWYRTKNHLSGDPNALVGNIAINDSLILESCIYIFVRKYFRSQPYYADLLDLFHDTTWQTELGQLLDLTTQPNRGDFTPFTLDTYNRIVKYKTAYYSFYLPVALAMILAGITNKKSFESALDILLPMGEYFQIQDDYLDCYGAPEVIGKVGRDIEENKCSWLICQAILNGTPEQIAQLKTVYGRDNPEDVAVVKKIFNDIEIPKIFKQYEDKSFAELTQAIKQSHDLPQAVFTTFLGRIYKRSV